MSREVHWVKSITTTHLFTYLHSVLTQAMSVHQMAFTIYYWKQLNIMMIRISLTVSQKSAYITVTNLLSIDCHFFQLSVNICSKGCYMYNLIYFHKIKLINILIIVTNMFINKLSLSILTLARYHYQAVIIYSYIII